MPATLEKINRDRLDFASLAVASQEPGASGTPLSLSIPAPPEGWVVVPLRFRFHTQVVGTGGLIGSVRNALFDDMDDRVVTISRIDAQGQDVAGTVTPTPLLRVSDRDRLYVQEVEVAALVTVPVLNGKGLKMVFSGIDATYERQYILCNYKTIEGVE